MFNENFEETRFNTIQCLEAVSQVEQKPSETMTTRSDSATMQALFAKSIDIARANSNEIYSSSYTGGPSSSARISVS